MPLRKKIFFSFLAMIMIGFAQMISSVSGVRQLTGYSEDLAQSHLLAQRVTELTSLINQLQRFELGYMTYYQGTDKTREQVLARHNKVLANLAKVSEQIAISQENNEGTLKTLDRLKGLLDEYKATFEKAQTSLTQLVSSRNLVSASLAQLRSVDSKPDITALLADTQSQWFQVYALLSGDKLSNSEGTKLIQSLRQSIATLQQKTQDQPLGAGLKKLGPLVADYLTILDNLGSEPNGLLAQLKRLGTQLEDSTTLLIESARKQLADNTFLLRNQIHNQQSWALVVGVVCMLLGVLLAFFLTREIVKPIEEFRNAADRVSRGDPNVILPEPTGDDEMAELSRAFQRMLNSLKALMSQDEDNDK